MTSLGPWHGGRRADPWDDYGGTMTSWRRGGDRGEDLNSLGPCYVDWRETDKAHIFRVDLPGVKKEDVKVQVEDNNILHISGDRVVEKEEEHDKWHRVERHRGSFSRRFWQPENANADEINCGLEQGVLTVEMPMMEVQEKPRNVRCCLIVINPPSYVLFYISLHKFSQVHDIYNSSF